MASSSQTTSDHEGGDPASVIDVSWLADLRRLQEKHEASAGLTLREIMQALNLSEGAARKLVRKCVAAGRMRGGRKPVQNVLGESQRVACYFPVESSAESWANSQSSRSGT